MIEGGIVLRCVDGNISQSQCVIGGGADVDFSVFDGESEERFFDGFDIARVFANANSGEVQFNGWILHYFVVRSSLRAVCVIADCLKGVGRDDL